MHPFVIEVMIFLLTNRKNPRKFQSDNSRTKNDMESRFSGLIRKINLIYSLWKPKLSKCTFSSRVCLVELFTNRKKAQSWKRWEMHKIAFLSYFSFESWKKFNSSGKNCYLFTSLPTLAHFFTLFCFFFNFL